MCQGNVILKILQKQCATGRAQNPGEKAGPPGEGSGSEDPMRALRVTGRQDDAMSHLCVYWLIHLQGGMSTKN